MRKTCTTTLLVCVFAVLLHGCGTIKNGKTQDLTIQSNPPGALVMIDGIEHGQTPVSVNLSRKDRHTVTVRMQGYQNFQTSLSKKLSGWAVLGGPVGLLIDDATGGMYKLSPDRLNVHLEPTE